MKAWILKRIKIIKNKFNNLIINTKELYKSDPIVFYYVFGAVFNAILLRFMSVKNYFGISPILADLFISCLFISLYFILKPKFRKIYLWILILLSTLICLANIVYYAYYDSFISVTFFSFAFTNTETGDSNVLGDLLRIDYFITLWFPIYMIIVHRLIAKKHKEKEKTPKKKALKIVFSWTLIFATLFIFTLKPIDYSRFYKQWNREYLVSRFGVYLYQINDVVKSVEPKMASLFGSDKAIKEVEDYYEANKIVYTKNKYTDIFKGKNVIAVHAESMQNTPLDLSFNGVEVTPYLNKLKKEGLYFSNFYSQVSFGTSSDTEFTVATSLLPVDNGTVFINYADKKYSSFYNLLREEGYYTFSMHANTGDFWNRNMMYKALGYDYFYEKSSYNLDELIGFGLSDRSFITQSVEKIKEISKEHKNFYGTLITLSNHTPFDEIESYGEYDVSKTYNGVKKDYLEGTKLGNYFKSVHYADKQLGLLVELLDKEGLLDDTIIMIYGDHDARISKSEWNYMYNYDVTTDTVKEEEDPGYIDIDYYWYELNRKVPLIIWSKDSDFKNNYAKNVTDVMGMIDVAPTLGNMMGIHNEYALGNDIFNIKENNLVAFPNGNYVTNKVYYSDSKDEYKILDGSAIATDYIEMQKQKTDTLLKISNNIVVYDYFKKINESTYEKEK